MGDEPKTFPHTDEQRDFLAALVTHGQLDAERAKDLGCQLVLMQTCHRWLCAMQSNGETIEPRTIEAIEQHAQHLVAAAPGVQEVQAPGDARGSTLRLRFADGHANSLSGAWNIPTDEGVYARLASGADVDLYLIPAGDLATPTP